MAAREEIDHSAEGLRQIIIRLDRPEQLFVAGRVDPWSSQYTEYTAQPAMVTVRDMLMSRMPRSSQRVHLVLILPLSATHAGLAAELTEAVRRWIRVQNLMEIDTIHADGAVGRRLFAMCSMVFMVLQTLSILVKNVGADVSDYLVDAVGEGLSVASWVMLWFPVQMFTVEVWRSSIRRRRSRILERITVEVVADG